MTIHNRKPGKSEPFNTKLYTAGVWEDHCVTYQGGLLGGLEMSGTDPTALGEHDRALYSIVQRALYQSLEPNIIFSQYYWHYEGNRISLEDREDPRSHLLSKRREQFLNDRRGLNGARLFWLLEVPCKEHINSILSVAFVKQLFSAPYEAGSRALIKQKLMNHKAWIVEEDQLNQQHYKLKGALQDLASRSEVISGDNSIMTKQTLWALHRALVNMDPSLLEASMREEVPSDEWDLQLANGAIKPVEINGEDYLKFEGPKPVYAKIASVIGYGTEFVHEGLWIRSERTPLSLRGNYLLINRWQPISKAGLSLMLNSKANELARQHMKLSALLKGDNPNSAFEEKVVSSAHLKKKIDELEDAANSPDRYGLYNTHVVVWHEDIDKLKEQCHAMKTALSESSLRVVWESAGQFELFPALLPGYGKKSTRSAEFTTSQAGATSLIYKAQTGKKRWGIHQSEATYVLESRDGCPVWFSEFIEDKGLVIGVGPTRSGKTVFKNALAAHFMKFGGFYQDIGIDGGAESLANFFGEEAAGVFRMTDYATSRGFNPFINSNIADGDKDGHFFGHMLRLITIMLGLNTAKSLQEITGSEQKILDEKIMAVMRIIDPKRRTLGTLHTHLPSELKSKLDRWVNEGPYANMFDNVEDGIGSLEKRIGIYNLSGLKDEHKLAALAQTEIFYRVSKLFENPRHENQIKQLQIDECQYFLEPPGAVEFLLAKVRTWNKWNAGISLWTQSAKHYAELSDWGMLRSAATTFIFGAEPKMDLALRGVYKTTFGASDGMVDAIASLKPRKEMFIWQPEAGVQQVVQLNLEKEQYVMSTSRPNEASIVRSLLAKYENDPDRAIDESIIQIEALTRKNLEG